MASATQTVLGCYKLSYRREKTYEGGDFLETGLTISEKWRLLACPCSCLRSYFELCCLFLRRDLLNLVKQQTHAACISALQILNFVEWFVYNCSPTTQRMTGVRLHFLQFFPFLSNVWKQINSIVSSWLPLWPALLLLLLFLHEHAILGCSLSFWLANMP